MSKQHVESTPEFFDSSFLSKLERLYLLSRKLFRGQHRAERRSRQIGSSLEFADYRNYVAGDDLRTIDWNVYGRLDRLFVKLFEEEQDLHIYILIDSSKSMRWRPEQTNGKPHGISKLDQARRVAASLAYVGLSNLDRVNIFYFTDRMDGDMGMSRGKSQFHKILNYLKQVPERAATTDLSDAMNAFTRRIKRRGLVFVLSDFLDPRGYENALTVLRHRQFEVHTVQVLDAWEMDPTLSGDLKLIEPEAGAILDVTISPAVLRRYKEGVLRFRQSLASYCQQHEIGYAFATTGTPFEDLVLKILREGRLLE